MLNSNCIFIYYRRSKKEYHKERVHRLVTPALFNMCFTSVIDSCFYFPHPFIHPLKNLQKGFIRSYQDIYSEPPLRQCWFLFYLYCYSMLLLPIFDKYHPKHRNGKCLNGSNSSIESPIWVLRYGNTVCFQGTIKIFLP